MPQGVSLGREEGPPGPSGTLRPEQREQRGCWGGLRPLGAGPRSHSSSPTRCSLFLDPGDGRLRQERVSKYHWAHCPHAPSGASSLGHPSPQPPATVAPSGPGRSGHAGVWVGFVTTVLPAQSLSRGGREHPAPLVSTFTHPGEARCQPLTPGTAQHGLSAPPAGTCSPCHRLASAAQLPGEKQATGLRSVRGVCDHTRGRHCWGARRGWAIGPLERHFYVSPLPPHGTPAHHRREGC